MNILGLKVTHDASVTYVEDGRLMFHYELEKLPGGERYTRMLDQSYVAQVLTAEGMTGQEVDRVVIDGWKNALTSEPIKLQVSGYHEFDIGSNGDALQRTFVNDDRQTLALFREYSSYHHVTAHIMGTYFMSGYNPETAYSICMDGGVNPRIHFVDPKRRVVSYVGAAHELHGVIYGIMGYYFGPFKRPDIIDGETAINRWHFNPMLGGYDKPGKLMAYVALGVINGWLLSHLHETYRDLEPMFYKGRKLAYNKTGIFEHAMCRSAYDFAKRKDISDEDALATIHHFLQELLIKGAVKLIPKGVPLIFSGGSALNIKWNSALRDNGRFDDVFVSPVPNDAGTSIGQVCCEMAHLGGFWELDWNVYAGPRLLRHGHNGAAPEGWNKKAMSAIELGSWLARNEDRACVALEGRAEIGPRALGHRSIFMSARRAGNKDYLNRIKKREGFRPVAPICMEEYAPLFFSPGSPDPYMLFEHKVIDERVPAIKHIDGSARLQTVSAKQDAFAYTVLAAYHSITGVPVLCNTSANRLGRGFFFSAEEAMSWAEGNDVHNVYANGFMYWRRDGLGIV